MPCRHAWLTCSTRRVVTLSTSGHTEYTRQATWKFLPKALQEDRIVVSADSDFGVILATQAADRPSFVLFRDPNLLVAHDFANMLVPALGTLAPETAQRVRRGLSKRSPASPQANRFPHKSP
jgi:predicted nuclease of predicted toxin-antitoxin system